MLNTESESILVGFDNISLMVQFANGLVDDREREGNTVRHGKVSGANGRLSRGSKGAREQSRENMERETKCATLKTSRRVSEVCSNEGRGESRST